MSEPLDNETKRLLKQLAGHADKASKSAKKAIRLIEDADKTMLELDKDAKG